MAIPIPTRQLFIDGEWREPVLKKRIPIINPATEQIIGLFLCFYLLLFVCVFLRSKLMMMCMLCNFVSGFWFSPESDKEKAIFILYTCISLFSFWFLTIWKKNWVNVCVFIRSKLLMMSMLCNYVSGFWFSPESDKAKSYL